MIARSLFARPFLRMATRQPRLRQFHVTPSRRYATPEQPNWEEMMRNDPKLQDTLEKLARHPSALQAMQNVSRIIKDQGFDPNTPPTKMDVVKLMMSSEFREAAQKLTDEMQKAGIEINPDAFMEMMSKK